jgi:hypothetical protein
MLRRDAAKGRNPEGSAPVLKQGIVGGCGLICHCSYLGSLMAGSKAAGMEQAMDISNPACSLHRNVTAET